MRSSIKSNSLPLFMTILRLAIGWHFIHEGLTKWSVEGWSSYQYLTNSTGFLSGFYHWLASSTFLLKSVDLLNVYGLLFLGVALFIGWMIRYAAVAGVLLLILYYFAYPPFGASVVSNTDGNVFIVNRIFIEAAALILFLVVDEKGYGIDKLFRYFRSKTSTSTSFSEPPMDSRRAVLKNLSTLPLLGLVGWGAYRSNQEYAVDAMSGATIQIKNVALSELKGELPQGKIGKHLVSRLVAGGNLIGGWTHSRDLMYVSSLSKAYNTEKKIFETLVLAEKAGINTINIGFPSNPVLAKYKKVFGSNIKVISQIAPNMESGNFFEQLEQAVDYGANILQVQGNWCDWLVRDNKLEVIEKMLNRIKEHGITAGLGAHTVDSLIACEVQGIIPDYYMQTMHHDRYWSAHPLENRIPFEVDGEKHTDHNRFHDNIFCLYPEKTVEFVNRTKVPVMGFKVLAAGAITPNEGFKWAFENGADFICVGMFDFQVVDDVNVCIDTLSKINDRKREWYA